ncbi:MAG TPA: hypothetical protein VE078_01320 [Thermoanaerobaculia bacterium]|nr:hypothetical protein [Thermoanaerobaculia bacterium]
MSNPQERPPVLLLAAMEALVGRGQACFADADLDAALSWLTEPAKSQTLEALRRSGWLEPSESSEAGGTRPIRPIRPIRQYRLTETGLRSYEAFQRATGAEEGKLLPGLAGQAGLERIVEALLSRGLDELAAAGREALLAVFPPPLLLSTDAIARSAERHKTG